MQTRVKICGITRLEDARAAAANGADAIGLVFTAVSPRRVDIEQARALCAALPPFVGRVGLFMDQDAEFIRSVLARVPLNWLQFHGSESAEFCGAFDRPYIKAIPMGGTGTHDLAQYPDAAALLLDSHAPGGAGGSGKPFDWEGFAGPDRPWILAGGLTADNVCDACRRLKPHAVDVSSGVEAAPGIKDAKLMARFIEAVRHG